MAAYLIADVDITDPILFEEYKREVPATEVRCRYAQEKNNGHQPEP